MGNIVFKNLSFSDSKILLKPCCYSKTTNLVIYIYIKQTNIYIYIYIYIYIEREREQKVRKALHLLY